MILRVRVPVRLLISISGYIRVYISLPASMEKSDSFHHIWEYYYLYKIHVNVSVNMDTWKQKPMLKGHLRNIKVTFDFIELDYSNI